MIPKIIHYCWFGRKKKPQDVINNIRNWQIVMPDYQIKEWNEDNFDLNSMTFTKEAYLVKKYAYVSDVVRLYALMTEGGIYLDTDVRALKPFDSYLHHSSFIGLEATSRLSTAVIGAMKATPWIHSFYTTYQRKHFIASKGRLLLTPNPYILTDFFNRNNLFENKEAVEVYGIICFTHFTLSCCFLIRNSIWCHSKAVCMERTFAGSTFYLISQTEESA